MREQDEKRERKKCSRETWELSRVTTPSGSRPRPMIWQTRHLHPEEAAPGSRPPRLEERHHTRQISSRAETGNFISPPPTSPLPPPSWSSPLLLLLVRRRMFLVFRQGQRHRQRPPSTAHSPASLFLFSKDFGALREADDDAMKNGPRESGGPTTSNVTRPTTGRPS